MGRAPGSDQRTARALRRTGDGDSFPDDVVELLGYFTGYASAFTWASWAIGLVCGTLLVGLSGTLATRRVVNTAPMLSLRED